MSDPKDIQPISDRDPTAPKANPPLTVMSLSIRTIVNHKANHREIVCATARIWSNSELPFGADGNCCLPVRLQSTWMIQHHQRHSRVACEPLSVP